MTETSFQDILNAPATAAPPQALPVGTYLCLVDGVPEITKIGKNNTDCVNYNLKPVQAQPDVDQNALREALNGKTLQDAHIRHRLFLTPDSVYRFDQFQAHLGLTELDAKGTPVTDKTRGQLISMGPGRQVMVTIGHNTSQDGQRVFMEVKSTAKV